MADDGDDDYTFGDFTFASFPSSKPNPAVISHPINGPKLAPIATNQYQNSANDDDDDEWGDFVKSPLAGAPSLTPSKPHDPFAFSSKPNEIRDVSLFESEQHQKKKGGWEKLKGPLPLSLFGDFEEEEEDGEKVGDERSGVNDLDGANGKDSLAKNVSSSSNVGLDDIIANLYPSSYNNNNQHIKADNGFTLNRSASNLDVKGTNLNGKDSNLELNGFSLNSASVDVKMDMENKDQKVKNSDELNLSSNGLRSKSNENAASLDFSGWGVDFEGLSSNLNSNEENKQGMAESNFNVGSNSLRSDLKTFASSVSTPSSDLGGWSFGFNGVGAGSDMLISNGSLNASSSIVSGLDLDIRDGELNDNDNDDDGWEFKDAFSETMTTDEMSKDDLRTGEISNTNSHSAGIDSRSNGSTDFFTFRDGSNDSFFMPNKKVFVESGYVGGELNVKSGTTAQISFSSDALLKSEPTDGKSPWEPDPEFEDAENDEDFGDFTAAFPETGLKKEGDLKSNDISLNGTEATTAVTIKQVVKVGWDMHEISQTNSYTSSSGSGLSGAIDLFSMSNEAVDLFPISNGINSTSLELNTEFGSMSSTAAQNVHLVNEQIDSRGDVVPHSVLETIGNDDDFGEFAAAFPEIGQKQEGELKATDHGQFEVEGSVSEGKDLGKQAKLENNKGALPLSIFGDEEVEDDNNIQHDFMPPPSIVQSNSRNPTSVISITDLISNLYSQTERNASTDVLKSAPDSLSPTTVFHSDLPNDADDFDDGPWEFKDSFGKAAAENEISLVNPEDAYRSSPSKVGSTNYMDFYSELEDVLCFVIKYHLENLKKAQNTAALSGEEEKVLIFDKEIQEMLKELDQEALFSQEDNSEGHPTLDASLHQFIDSLQCPKLQILESEYGLSRSLAYAAKDLKPALDLRKHAKTMLKILSLGSLEDQLIYISLWSKVMSVCAQELQRGAKIWKQSQETNLQTELLSEPQGKKFIQALGEIYRVALVLGASARLYKPWSFESSPGSNDVYALLDECHSVWSSGLGEALSGMLHLVSAEDDTGIATLIESIQYIHNLDLFTLQDHVLDQHESRCGLSLLTSESIPGLKLVSWDGEQYFVKLANLWANLISCEPPRVPRLHLLVAEKAG